MAQKIMTDPQFSSVIRYSLYFGAVFKLVTFLFNQLLIKFVPPSYLAFNNFLEFLINSITFFAAEGIRLSCQRIPNANKKSSEETKPLLISNTYEGSSQSIINLSYLPLVLGVPISSVIIYLQFGNFTEYFQENDGIVSTLLLGSKNLQISVIVVTTGVSIMLNLLTEPFYNLVNYNSQFHLRTKYESTGLIVNCFFNFLTIATAKKLCTSNPRVFDELAILIFALGKLFYSITVYLLYYQNYQKNEIPMVRLTPQKIINKDDNSYYFDKYILNYWKTIFLQMIFKNFLTEGDKFIFNYFFDLNQQGIYSIINNYGSLITRLVFNPIEESLKLILSKMFTATDDKNKKNSTQSSMKIIRLILKFYIYLTFVLVLFGYFNAPFLGELFFTKIIKVSWWNANASTVKSLITFYVIYLPFLAINGIFEAFCQSISTDESIKKYSYFLSVCSLVFFGNCYLFIEVLQLQLAGLVISNIVNMGLRIFYCSISIKNFYSTAGSVKVFDFNDIIGNWKLFLGVSIGVLSIQIQLNGITQSFTGLLKNLGIAVFYVGFIIYNERSQLIPYFSKFQRK
ncbi:glycolipid translocation protein [Saccharomycopsis crataegensis]|uniref:Man(5)GlcNAc(2)-PP-dolichol translocation protein RFT1 n=1 Tax=Saccharomycopsis crataegensis TaxID=43959 RepID=A0AAV5QPA7_9ASCO|nr:glycolipid translocation protein [Saccharomycopsis crataegensis]